MHIVFFNRAFYPEESATGRFLTELAEDLVRVHGHRISVVSGIPLGNSSFRQTQPKSMGPVCEERFRGIRILRARGTCFSKKRFWGRAFNYLTYFFSACCAVPRLEKADVVIAFTDPPIIGLAGWLASRRFRCPLLISYCDLFPEAGHLLIDFRNPIVDWALHQTNRFLLRASHRVIALGEDMRKRLLEEKGADPRKVILIRDWADTAALVPFPKDNPFSRRNGLADRFVVMHSGNIGNSQQLEILIEAASLLLDLPDLRVVLVGEGVQKPALQEQVGKRGLSNVLFLPYQPKDRLCESFGAADCFVISLKAGLSGIITPSKLYGILAAGRAYVAAVDPEGDVAKLTRKFQCGLLSPPGNPSALAETIRALYRDRKLRQTLGERGRAASFQFDRSVGVKNYDALCRSVGRTW